MTQDMTQLTQVLHFKLEKIDDATGEVVEIIEGGDGLETKVTFKKEQENGIDDSRA